MHTIHKKTIDLSLFSCEKLDKDKLNVFQSYVNQIEAQRQVYLMSKNPSDWIQIIQMLPSSFNQLRTCTLNFETLINIENSRANHKLCEWRTFCEFLSEITYFEDIAL